jgi:hypothetical protein
MARFPDWPQRLSRAIEARRRLPHAWGSNDCALFAADLVAAQTGQDFGAPFRRRYSDREGADAILASLGHGDLADLVDSCLPRGEGRPQRGDVVLQPGPEGPFLTIAWGGGVVGPGPDGAALVARDAGAPFWRVD